MGIDLKYGFLFRTSDRKGNISNSPFVGSAVSNRLRKHLTDFKILGGEQYTASVVDVLLPYVYWAFPTIKWRSMWAGKALIWRFTIPSTIRLCP